MSGFADRYGPWAVVTGAGAGMGAAFVNELHARGLHVLLVDRDAEGLARHAGPGDRTLQLDLCEPDAAGALTAAVDELDVGLLVSNAAISYTRAFLDETLEEKLAQLRLNVELPLRLVHHALPALVRRGRGGVVLVASLAGLRGTALEAGYAASKAWTIVLGESLWDELRDHGVDVLSLLPGTTNTPGFASSRPRPGLGTSNVMEPADVVREGLDALGAGPSHIAGQANRDAEAFMAALDRMEAVVTMGRVMRQMYPSDR